MSWIQQKEAATLEKKSSILKELNRQNFNTLTIYLSQFVAGNKFKSVDKPTIKSRLNLQKTHKNCQHD